jgi:hypothetical protein
MKRLTRFARTPRLAAQLSARLALLLSLVLGACSQSSAPASSASAGENAGGAVGSAGTSASAGAAASAGMSAATAGNAAGGFVGIGGAAGGSVGESGGVTNLGGSPPAGGASSAGSNGIAGGGDHSGAGGASVGSAGTTALPVSELPGDLAAAAGTPLVAAHSMTRAFYAAYHGNLFQVRRSSDSKTQDIGVSSAGGHVDTGALSQFCAGATCTVAKLYDQTGNGNDLSQGTAAYQMGIAYRAIADGSMAPLAFTINRQYLRNRTNTSKIPKGAASQTEYFVVDGHRANSKCCWDYGNMEAQVKSDGVATMSALNFGVSNSGYSSPGTGAGPWAMVDFENGVYAGPNRIGVVNQGSPSITYDVVTILSKTNGTTSWVMKVGNAAAGPLKTTWDGALPNGYNPLRQEGGLSLGEGGDGTPFGTGGFFEGVVIAAVTSDATDNAIQANITSVYAAAK